ncbi:hypothetical protein DTL36_15490 [Bremerella cremea]|nr:hypothetical protein DTL36_15490 [Bremerella cremea]
MLLNDLSRIEQLYIEQGLIEHSHSEVTDYFTKSHPRSLRELRLILDPLPSDLLARWIRTDGLTVLYLDRQVIDKQVWQAIVEAPTLRKIQFDDCKFPQIDQFSSSERPIKVEIFDWESALDDEPSCAVKVRRLLNAGEDPPSEP